MHRFLPRLGEAIIEDIGEADSVPFAPVAERTFAVLEEINDIISPRCAPAASSLRGTQLRAREPHEEFSAWMEAQSYEEIIASVGVGYHRYAFVQGPPLEADAVDNTGLVLDRLASTQKGSDRWFKARLGRASAEMGRLLELRDHINPVDVTLSGVALPKETTDTDAKKVAEISAARASQVRLLELLAVLPARTRDELADHYTSIKGTSAVDCPAAALAVLSALAEARDRSLADPPMPFDAVWPPGTVPVSVVWHLIAEQLEAARRDITAATIARRTAVFDLVNFKPPQFYDTLDPTTSYTVDVFTASEAATLKGRFRALAQESHVPVAKVRAHADAAAKAKAQAATAAKERDAALRAAKAAKAALDAAKAKGGTGGGGGGGGSGGGGNVGAGLGKGKGGKGPANASA